MRRILVGLLLLASLSNAQARWKPEYASLTEAEQRWYSERQVTEATKKRIGFDWYNYCCDHADVVEAQFSKDNGQWRYRLSGEAEWKTMPQDIVQEGIATPHDRPVLFVDPTFHKLGPICFFPGAAGT